MTVLGGASRQSLAAVRDDFEKQTAKLSADAALKLSGDLFSVLQTLNESVALRRALTDNSRDASAKSDLVADLFAKNISSTATAIVANASKLRWSNPNEYADAVELLAVSAAAKAANEAGELALLSEQLFNFAQVLIANPELRQTLNSANESVARRIELLQNVTKGAYSNYTNSLLSAAIKNQRGRNIDNTLAQFSKYVSQSEQKVIAHVTAAVKLTPAQVEKLATSLSKQIGKKVQLNVEVDPKVLGGLSVHLDDELIDGTVSARLQEAGRILSGI